MNRKFLSGPIILILPSILAIGFVIIIPLIFSFYTSFTFGIGGALGGVFSGYAWEWMGPEFTFSISALAAFLGLGLIIWKVNIK